MSNPLQPVAAAPVPPDTETSRTIIVRVSPTTHKALRIRVAQEDTSIQKWVEQLIERTLAMTEPELTLATQIHTDVKPQTRR